MTFNDVNIDGVKVSESQVYANALTYLNMKFANSTDLAFASWIQANGAKLSQARINAITNDIATGKLSSVTDSQIVFHIEEILYEKARTLGIDTNIRG